MGPISEDEERKSRQSEVAKVAVDQEWIKARELARKSGKYGKASEIDRSHRASEIGGFGGWRLLRMAVETTTRHWQLGQQLSIGGRLLFRATVEGDDRASEL